MEDSACIVKDLKDVSILLRYHIPMRHISGGTPQAFKADMFFEADWQAMQRANRTLVLLVVCIKLLRSIQCSFRKQLGDAVSQTLADSCSL
jgi:hypothetical protein